MIMYISHFKYSILLSEEHEVFKEIWNFDLLLEGDILDLPSWIYVVLSR